MLLSKQIPALCGRRATLSATLSGMKSNIRPTSRHLSKSAVNLESEGMKLSESELQGYKTYYKELQETISNVPEEVALQSQPLVTLHNRLELPPNFDLSTLSRCLTCRSSKLPTFASSNDKNSTRFQAFPNTVESNDLFDNHGLNIFGKNILGFHITKYLLTKYPRLPTVVLNAAIDSYISQDMLSNIARSWGIEKEDTAIVERYLANEPISLTLGKLRYFNNTLGKIDGIERLNKGNFSENSALALTVRSVIGVLWTIKPELAEKFINKHIISRKLDVSKLFLFEQPTRELAKLCEREGLEKPISRLTAESGRLSKAPVFIVGVFSGEEKLGEGFGSSLKEAKARAATDALLKWYCYEPILQKGQAPVIDHGTVIV
ncbi:similar to Saccharomyces cerevisiae YMR024W MRPL3 Mitochondrial ribosomal protein of the large subunit [Maudiozyma barnettii]|uniref:Large ribosomal subunit protein mL44 n=1 Tax=Maudiozyma barnettii TaxID=61262 RepID=A0A8H2VJM2_9SACH|nr:mitochondrial 54S ribosomal protein YmL3 [Kazachstania barnettii]CAB4256909.1 similar to Saccharomyces cerevisiae YMR024W MRPL3 Mitochondrial ribosomal protein of the large subunit [Kazachstania barnettii]CAD1785514.1 similar to Saccharomyces cerevisiae YMR024W MRPL3 Mitochondrial ribosomal protein of the large subunit [Kazachstania barnettii]